MIAALLFGSIAALLLLLLAANIAHNRRQWGPRRRKRLPGYLRRMLRHQEIVCSKPKPKTPK